MPFTGRGHAGQRVGWVERLVRRSSTSEGGSDTHHGPNDGDGFREALNPSYDCPTGKSAGQFIAPRVQPPLKKYSDFPKSQITLYPQPSCPTEGRFAIVTDAGQDAVDVDAPITNGAEADGEVVWS
jgi:hypothetical protein